MGRKLLKSLLCIGLWRLRCGLKWMNTDILFNSQVFRETPLIPQHYSLSTTPPSLLGDFDFAEEDFPVAAHQRIKFRRGIKYEEALES